MRRAGPHEPRQKCMCQFNWILYIATNLKVTNPGETICDPPDKRQAGEDLRCGGPHWAPDEPEGGMHNLQHGRGLYPLCLFSDCAEGGRCALNIRDHGGRQVRESAVGKNPAALGWCSEQMHGKAEEYVSPCNGGGKVVCYEIG